MISYGGQRASRVSGLETLPDIFYPLWYSIKPIFYVFESLGAAHSNIEIKTRER
jgi:hypothetical protein